MPRFPHPGSSEFQSGYRFSENSYSQGSVPDHASGRSEHYDNPSGYHSRQRSPEASLFQNNNISENSTQSPYPYITNDFTTQSTEQTNPSSFQFGESPFYEKGSVPVRTTLHGEKFNSDSSIEPQNSLLNSRTNAQTNKYGTPLQKFNSQPFLSRREAEISSGPMYSSAQVLSEPRCATGPPNLPPLPNNSAKLSQDGNNTEYYTPSSSIPAFHSIDSSVHADTTQVLHEPQCATRPPNHWPFVMMAYRSSVPETTKCTPNLLFLGQEAYPPVDHLHGSQPDSPPYPVAYVEWVRLARQQAYHFVEENTHCSASRRKLLYNRNCGYSKFQIGDTVWRSLTSSEPLL